MTNITGAARAAFGILLLSCAGRAAAFDVAVTCDQRNFTGPGTYDQTRYFRGVCEAIALRTEPVFMVSPGDIDPPADCRWTIDQIFGTDFLWFPVVGNHEEETASDMAYLRSYVLDPNGAAEPNIVRTGPTGCVETTYSFDYENVHFAVINEYYDGVSDTATDGDVPDSLYNWLAADLAATTKQHIFVIGHEPAFPRPDADNGRERHIGSCLDKYPTNRNRFWNLLRDGGVVAYLTGHTHNYSSYVQDGVWQLDAGHARGAGDTGAPSTFLILHIDGDDVWFEAFRDAHDGTYDYRENYHVGVLRGTVTPSGAPGGPPGSLFFVQARPNPFNPSVRVVIGLAKEETVSLAIYDAAGALVRTLLEERRGPGPHEVVWDGTDAWGRPAPSGTYFCRIVDGTRGESRKLTLVR
jgi:hypothetical protein